MRSTKLMASLLATTLALTAGPAMAQAQEGHVTIVLPDALNAVDPCQLARNDVGRVLRQNVTETLTELDPASGDLKPRLALSWEDRGDGTWRFSLRPDVVFHDGAPMDAAAVATAIERTMNPDLDCTTRQQKFGGITLTTTVVDDLTVDIAAEPAQPILPLLFSNLAITSPAMPMDALSQQPIGTGPYVFARHETGQRVELESFEGYWGEAPAVRSASFVYRGESAVQAAMVATGEADIAPYIATQDATDPATDVTYLNTETAQVAFAANVPPLNDIRVRQALNYALDREALIGTILSADVQPASQIVLPFITGYNDQLQPFPYDIEKAKALLAEAKADGVPVDAPIILYGRPGFLANLTDVMTALSEMWKAAGFDISMQVVERQQFVSLVSSPHPSADERDAALFLNLHDNNTGDAGASLFFKYHSDGRQTETYDARVDAAIDEGIASTGDKRQESFAEAFRLIQQEILPDAMLYHLVGHARVGARVNWQPSTLTNAEIKLEDISFR